MTDVQLLIALIMSSMGWLAALAITAAVATHHSARLRRLLGRLLDGQPDDGRRW